MFVDSSLEKAQKMSATHYKNILFPRTLFLVLVLVLLPSVVKAVSITKNTTISSDNNDQQNIDAANITITVTSTGSLTGQTNAAVKLDDTNSTLIVNSGATVSSGNYTVNPSGTSPTITNSGTIHATNSYAILATSATDLTITTNSGGGY